MKRLLLFFLLISFLSAACLFIVYKSGWITNAPSFATEIVLVLAFTTLVIYYYLQSWSKSKAELFTQFYLLSIAVKIVAYGAFVAFIIIDQPEMAIGNVVVFLCCYLTFTLAEVLFLFRQTTHPAP